MSTGELQLQNWYSRQGNEELYIKVHCHFHHESTAVTCIIFGVVYIRHNLHIIVLHDMTLLASGKNFIKITNVGMGAAKSNETR